MSGLGHDPGETLRAALGAVRARSWRQRALVQASHAALGLSAIALLGQAIRLAVPAFIPTTVSVTLGIAALLVIAVYGWRASRVESLERAAFLADQRLSLHDEMRSALHFMTHAPHDGTGAWMRAVLQRAAARARSLQPRSIVPYGVPRQAYLALAAILLLLASSFITPRARTVTRAALDGLSSAEQMRIERVRSLLGQDDTHDSAVKRELESTLRTLASGTSSARERETALQRARSAVERQNLEMAASWEKLDRIAEAYRGRAEVAGVVEAIKSRDLKKAAAELRQLSAQAPPGERNETGAGAKETAGATPDRGETDLARLSAALEKSLPDPKAGDSTSADTGGNSGAARNLDAMADRVELQRRMNDADRELNEFRNSISRNIAGAADRLGDDATAPSRGQSPDTGNAPIPGGTMFRKTNTGADTEPPRVGNRVGSAMGDAVGRSVLGTTPTRLAVQLKLENFQRHDQTRDPSGRGVFYTASRQQTSQLEAGATQARGRYAQAEANSAERIAIGHRQVVKDYFVTLHETPNK